MNATVYNTVIIGNNSQFPVFERADEDIVLLQRHVFMAVWRDDLVKQTQETGVKMRRKRENTGEEEV